MRADDAWTDNSWTDDRVAILKQMWGDGATAAAIAERLGGLSRSAVLGKICRLRHGTCAPSLAANEEEAVQAILKPAALAHRPSGKQRAPQPSPNPRPKASRGRGKSLLELTNDSCRWPHGEPGSRSFFFCGATGADLECGRPYCAHHALLAYSSAAISAEDDGESVIAVRNSPSIAPFDSPRRSVWRSPVNHPAPRSR
jgi:GcrA cell cycle regulator